METEKFVVSNDIEQTMYTSVIINQSIKLSFKQEHHM